MKFSLWGAEASLRSETVMSRAGLGTRRPHGTLCYLSGTTLVRSHLGECVPALWTCLMFKKLIKKKKGGPRIWNYSNFNKLTVVFCNCLTAILNLTVKKKATIEISVCLSMCVCSCVLCRVVCPSPDYPSSKMSQSTVTEEGGTFEHLWSSLWVATTPSDSWFTSHHIFQII